MTIPAEKADVLVIFGATGDLAKLETFPALVGLTAMALGSCTLVPIPLTDPERMAEADADRAAMFGDQEPLM